MPAPTERRLAAILAADAVGYSRLMAEDEAGTIRTVTAYRHEISGLVGDHRGRVVDTAGDGALAEFPTALDAVECALEIQRVLGARNAGLPAERRMEYRIGVHLGDISVEDDRIYGDGVNIAARLEGLAEAGGICISGTVYDLMRGKLDLRFEDLGEQEVKNIPEPVRVYRVRPADEVTPRSSWRSWRSAVVAAGGLVVLGVAALVLWRLFPARDVSEATSGTTLAPAVAVLPFADMSPERDQEYFADGMAEEIITALSRVEGLRVVARTSAFAFKGKNEDIREIGRQLDVGAVVEGSVRKDGERLRITAQLIRVEDGFHMWAETYDRELDDVFLVQDQIARATVAALKVQLLSSATLVKSPGLNPRAYELYLVGRHSWNLRTGDGMRTAVRYFEQALELDPDYAPALAGLADAHTLLCGYRIDPCEEAMSKAESAITRALAIDAESGELHASLGFLRILQWRWDDAERELRRAVELRPGYATGHQWYGILLQSIGREEAAADEFRRALELDPLSPVINRNAAMPYLYAGDYEAAAELLAKTLELNPADPIAPSALWQAYARQGLDREAAEVIVSRALPSVQKELRVAFDEAGLRGLLRKRLELEIARTDDPCPRWSLEVLAWLDERDRMFVCMEAITDRAPPSPDFGMWRTHPVFDAYRSDPRFTALLRRIGLEGRPD